MKMFDGAYTDWNSIFNEEIETVWQAERVELRKISMIYHAFEKELDNLKSILNNELVEIKTEVKKRNHLSKCKNFAGLAETQGFKLNTEADKENESPEHVLNERNRSEEYYIESPNTESFLDCLFPPKPKSQETSPVLNKTAVKKKSTPPGNPYPVINHKVEKTPPTLETKIDNNFKTPKNLNDSDIMDSSVIIDNTPDYVPARKTKKLSLKTSKKAKAKQKNTITQMFHASPVQEKTKKKKKEIDSQASSMSINAMLDLINQQNNSGSDTEDDLNNKSDSTLENLELINTNHKDLPLSSFIADYNKVPETKSEPSKFVKEVVRGKERKKLKGWSCNECKNYYEGLNLSPDELQKKMDQCSRHRHRFQPREDTYSGFWDLTFGPTPKTQEETEKSMVFNFKKT